MVRPIAVPSSSILPHSLLPVETYQVRAAVTNQPVFVWTAACPSMLLQKCFGGKTWPLRLKGALLVGAPEWGKVVGEKGDTCTL